MALNQPTLCTATVDDVDAGSASTPVGTVELSSSSGTGTFGIDPCTLVLVDANTSACSSSYTPTAGTGTHLINGAYSGSAVHEVSDGDFGLLVTQRSTSTSLTCDTPVAIDEPSTCEVTVTDTDAGTASDPAGTVDFTSDNPTWQLRFHQLSPGRQRGRHE